MRPLKKDSVDHKAHFAAVLNSVLIHYILAVLVGDNPKRSFFRDSLQHSAKYACEYCFESGLPFSKASPDSTTAFIKKIQEQRIEVINEINNLLENDDSGQVQALRKILANLNESEKLAKKNKQSSHIVWPANTFSGELRTKEKILEIVEKIEAGENLSHAEKKGIKGRSLLLNIDYFDYTSSITTEYMHCVCLGLVKRLLELTFSVGESRQRNTKRPLSSPNQFNELMKKVKTFKEFNRRARKLDLAVMKAQELRNCILFYFTIVTECLNGDEKEIKLWEMLAFMIRSCILPENEFTAVNVNQIKYCQKQFYLMYQNLFGPVNCTYSVHVVSSHLMQMRAEGPLTETSAFRFEAFYAELRKSFQPGTVSVLKQMMQSILLKRILSHHVCQESIYFSPKDTALESNSIIYLYVNNVHVIYKILSIENEILTCNQIGNHEAEFPHTNMLNWSSVGVYRKGGLSSETVFVNKKDVAGKVIRVGKYLMTCPANVLREK